MSPSQFLAKYHSLAVVDPLLGINCTININKYVSGMPGTHRTEYEDTISKIAGKFLKLKKAKYVPTWFSIDDSRIPTGEQFSKPGLKRAYGGRGSTDEIRDAVRLAVLTGRCKASGAATYAKTWFGQDCNAFVGNYQGISPSTSIAAYVAGYGSGTIKGASADVYMTVGRLPLPPITKQSQIVCGTVLITYRPEKVSSYGSNWGHIALVDGFRPNGTDTRIDIVEWGQGGGTSAHTDPNKKINLLCQDFGNTIDRFRGKEIYGFWDKSNKDLRIFLDASKWNDIAHRGWHIGNEYES